MAAVLSDIAPALRQNALVVSVAAGILSATLLDFLLLVLNHRPRYDVRALVPGITIKSIQAALPPQARIIRVMPNTPCLVGASASGTLCSFLCRLLALR